MAFVRTVCGDIEPSKLGKTMAHEHLFMQKGRVDGPETDLSLWRWDPAVAMAKEFVGAGGGCIVEATPRYWDGRDPAGMAAVSRMTGLNIVASTGVFGAGPWNDLTKEFADKSIDEIAEGFIKEIEEGMDGTDIKAGSIKGCSMYNYITPGAEKAMRAGARAAIATGAPMHTHTDCGTFGIEQMEIVESEGLPLDQFMVCHIDRNPDYWYHKQLAKKGVYLCYDGPGKAKYYPDEIRINVLKRLVADGFGKQIVFSNDMGRKTHHKVFGYGPGWCWIMEKFIPRLLKEGFTQEQCDDFMINNPARFLTMRK